MNNKIKTNEIRKKLIDVGIYLIMLKLCLTSAATHASANYVEYTSILPSSNYIFGNVSKAMRKLSWATF